MNRQVMTLKMFSNMVYFVHFIRSFFNYIWKLGPWHSRGQRFDPAYLHQNEKVLENIMFLRTFSFLFKHMQTSLNALRGHYLMDLSGKRLIFSQFYMLQKL